jgi:TonB family protein
VCRINAIFVLLLGTYLCVQSVAQNQPPHSESGNAAVVALSSPIYPPSARVANIWGDVKVTVTIRPDGTVEGVTLVSGHPMLIEAALDSARQTRFECRGCATATASYQMLYTFKMVEGPDCCRARTVAPKIEQQSQPNTSFEGWQTHVIITAEKSCVCDPAVTITRRIRSRRCLYLWKCSTS